MEENALARRSRFSDFLAPILEPWSGRFFDQKVNQLFDHFLPNFLNHLEPTFGTRSTQKGPR